MTSSLFVYEHYGIYLLITKYEHYGIYLLITKLISHMSSTCTNIIIKQMLCPLFARNYWLHGSKANLIHGFPKEESVSFSSLTCQV